MNLNSKIKFTNKKKRIKVVLESIVSNRPGLILVNQIIKLKKSINSIRTKTTDFYYILFSDKQNNYFINIIFNLLY